LFSGGSRVRVGARRRGHLQFIQVRTPILGGHEHGGRTTGVFGGLLIGLEAGEDDPAVGVGQVENIRMLEIRRVAVIHRAEIAGRSAQGQPGWIGDGFTGLEAAGKHQCGQGRRCGSSMHRIGLGLQGWDSFAFFSNTCNAGCSSTTTASPSARPASPASR
jgi:hypothetical protein